MSRKFCKTHEWIELEGDIATIGLTDFAQKELGDIVYISLPDEGDALKIGVSFSEVESVKAVSDVYSPVDGEVVEINEALADAPELINKDPHGAWLIRARVSKMGETITEAEYTAFVKK